MGDDIVQRQPQYYKEIILQLKNQVNHVYLNCLFDNPQICITSEPGSDALYP